MWAPQVEALEAAGHNVVAPDLPGFGDAPLEPGTIDYVGFAASHVDGPATVAAARSAAGSRSSSQRHARISSSGSSSSAPASEPGTGRSRRRPASPRRRRRSSAATSMAAAAQQARMWLADDASPEVRALTEAMTLRSYEQQLPMEDQVKTVWPDVPAQKRLAEIVAPTLVVVGSEDVDDIKTMAERLAGEIPGAQTGDDRGRRPPAEPRAPGRAQPAAARLPSLRNGVGERGPGGLAHSPNDSSDSAAATSPRSGSIQRNVAVPGFEPKWPYVRGELREPVQCGDFAPRSSKPRPQSFGVSRPKPGRTPSSPGNWTDGRLGERLRRDQRRLERLAAEAEHVAEVADDAARGVAVEGRAERRAAPAPRRAGSRGTASPPAPRAWSASDEVARVRVDAALAGLAERLRRVPREAGRVREQVPHRRALGPGRLVEIQHAFLGRDQRRVGGEQLRHRAPAEPMLTVAVLGNNPVGRRDPGCVVLGRPFVDLAKRIHGGRY